MESGANGDNKSSSISRPANTADNMTVQSQNKNHVNNVDSIMKITIFL